MFSLHPLLVYSVDIESTSSIIWDLRNPISTSLHASRNVPLSDIELSTLATTPLTTVLHITCDVLPLWPIEARNEAGVTIRDVLEAIFSTVTSPLKVEEWSAFSLKQQKRVNQAFIQRCEAAVNKADVWAYGTIRADCLLKHVAYAGLSESIGHENTCILSLRYLRPLDLQNTSPGNDPQPLTSSASDSDNTQDRHHKSPSQSTLFTPPP